jgi:hypothetical protein
LCFYWNETLFHNHGNFEKQLGFTILDYVVSLFNISCNTNITKNHHIQYVQLFLKNTTNVLNYDILIPSIAMPITKVDQIPSPRIEHSHPIIGPIVTQKENLLIGHFIFYLL